MNIKWIFYQSKFNTSIYTSCMIGIPKRFQIWLHIWHLACLGMSQHYNAKIQDGIHFISPCPIPLYSHYTYLALSNKRPNSKAYSFFSRRLKLYAYKFDFDQFYRSFWHITFVCHLPIFTLRITHINFNVWNVKFRIILTTYIFDVHENI